MQKPTLQTILISILIIVALFTSIYFPYKWKQLSNDFLNQTNQYGELLNQINDLEKEVRELKGGKIKEEKIIVLSPAKGDVWIIGKVYQIRWIPINPSKKVTIQLLDLGKRGAYQTIWSQEVLDNGIYQFTIPLDLYPVKNAQLHIGNDLKGFFSEGFSIISKDKIANWKIYRNEEYGFEINYPMNWIVDDNKNSISFNIKENDKEYWLTVEMFQNIEELNLKQYIEKLIKDNEKLRKELGGPVFEYEKVEKIKIANNIPAYKFYNVSGGVVTNYEYIYLLNKKYIYEFRFPPAMENSALLNPIINNEIVYQILSAFKFIE